MVFGKLIHSFLTKEAVNDSHVDNNNPAKYWTVAIPPGKPCWHMSKIHIDRVNSSVPDKFLLFATVFVRAETPFSRFLRVSVLTSNAAATFGIDGY